MGGVDWGAIERSLASHVSRRIEAAVSGRAAVAVVLRQGGKGIEVLFIHRAEHPGDPWSGHMAFPGGRAEPGDRDLKITAIRETHEEVGLDLARDGAHLGSLDEIQAMRRFEPVDLAITPHVFRLERAGDLVLSPEVRGAQWIGLDDLLGPSHRATFDHVHEGRTVRLPCFRVDDKIIWGLTYRMFASFQWVLEPAASYGTRTPR